MAKKIVIKTNDVDKVKQFLLKTKIEFIAKPMGSETMFVCKNKYKTALQEAINQCGLSNEVRINGFRRYEHALVGGKLYKKAN